MNSFFKKTREKLVTKEEILNELEFARKEISIYSKEFGKTEKKYIYN